MKSKNKFSNIFDHILDYMCGFAGILLIAMALLINFGVINRYVFSNSVGWPMEISSYCMVYITFLVAAWVLKLEGHVSIDILLEYIKPRSRALLQMITSSICAICSFFMAWYGAMVTIDLYRTHYFMVSLLMPPKWIIIIVIFIGMLMLFIQFLRRTYSYWKVWKGQEVKNQAILEKEGLF